MKDILKKEGGQKEGCNFHHEKSIVTLFLKKSTISKII
jgi:hypothetical protein